MNVEIGAEAALFSEKEYIKGIFVAVQCPPTGLEPMPHTSVALIALLYLNVRQRKLGTIIILDCPCDHLQHDTVVVTGSLPEGKFCIGNPTYFQKPSPSVKVSFLCRCYYVHHENIKLYPL